MFARRSGAALVPLGAIPGSARDLRPTAIPTTPTPTGARSRLGGTAHVADLDVLRGVAAVLVVLYHVSERAGLPFLCPRGYLGVDLFFAMSGYVLMHAYGEKLACGRLGIGRFVAIRLIRLGPMIVLGTTIAAVVELGRPSVSPAIHLRDIGEAWIRGCLLLPMFRRTTLEYIVYPLDGPVWSLFFELVSNVMLAVFLVRGVRRAPFVLCLGASLVAMTAYLAGHSSLEYAGSVGDEFAYGFPRVGVSFSLGILLFVVRRRIRLRADRRLVAASFVLLCLVPALPGVWNPILDGVAVLVVMPAIVLASGSETPVGHPDRIALWSGRISYPLYAIHYPFVRAAGVVLSHHGLGVPVRLVAVAVLVPALVALAAGFDVVYDRPVRARLSRMLAAR